MIVNHIDLKRDFSGQIPRRGYLTHGFDRYPAKMIPAMARFLIEHVSIPGQTVLDPFCGSGAVLVEALDAGRNSVGIDINPLAIILARAKTTGYSLCDFENQLDYLLFSFRNSNCFYRYDFTNANYWFTSGTLRKLGKIKSVLDQYLPTIEPEYATFWQGVLAVIVRECSRADTRGPKPFISKTAREKRCGKHFDPFKYFESKARFWISLTERFAARLETNDIQTRTIVIQGDSRELTRLLNGSQVDAIVTSPPYLSAQDYYRSCKLELFTLGLLSPEELRRWSRHVIGSDKIKLDEALLSVSLNSCLAEDIRRALSKHSRKNACVFAQYVLDMSLVLNEFKEVLKNGGYCALASGHNFVSGIVIPTYDVIAEVATNQKFALTGHYVDKIRDRWVPTVRNGHKGVIQEEHLLIFQKPDSEAYGDV